MTQRNMERDRRWRDTENDNDWDWYYYEYRYLPYGSDRYMQDQNRYGRENDYRSRESNSWGRGPYTGRGPRGYSRSDDRIKEDINERLTWHSGIDPTDVQVEVNEGTVTLTGSVNSRYEKRMAEDIVDGVYGIEDVNNNLSINKHSGWDRGSSGRRMSNQIREGMDVVGREGDTIGQVKEVRSYDFLVDRPMARDIYIPFSACDMNGGQIQLNIGADEVDDQNWPASDLLGTEEPAPATRNKR